MIAFAFGAVCGVLTAMAGIGYAHAYRDYRRRKDCRARG